MPSDPPPDMAIVARDVTLSLGAGAARVHILRGLSLDVATGERLAILGPSGSGKSSLMACLSGLESPTSGQIRAGGIDLVGRSEDELAAARRGRIGIVLQAFHLIPTMTAIENVAIPLELAGAPDARARAAAELRDCGLGARLHHYPLQLSGGEQQRVALARALVVRPALLFADEPTGNLDAEAGAAIVELLFRRLDATGATLLLITHDEALAQRCSRIIRLHDGQIVHDGPAGVD